MNIFYLHYLTKQCAQAHFDKHVVKMILETMQLLSSVWWILDPVNAIEYSNNGHIYKLSHKNHPCAKWARESKSNYIWLAEFGIELCKEYTHRYEKIHATQSKIEWAIQHIPNISILPELGMTKPVQAMPDECKTNNPIEAYRNLYQSKHKRYMYGWKKRQRPDWFTEESYQLGQTEKNQIDEHRKKSKISKKINPSKEIDM